MDLHKLEPDPHALAEIDAVVARFYAAFDNRGGRPVEVVALSALFAPGAAITRVTSQGVDTWDVEGFIAPRAALLGEGEALSEFHEREVAADTTVFENIAGRRSAYRKDGRLDGAPYAGAGRKLIQLCRIGGAWRIASVLWEDDG